ncbi:MAG: carbohydrate binding family 9 domain-containing protein [Saprospiraceae bacterium]|nr:carbohydrate binding family 9 domain-containing protein [Saprospiraceae bacterium]
MCHEKNYSTVTNCLDRCSCYGTMMEQTPVRVVRASEPILVDGKMDEAAWFKSKPAKDFWLYFPTDSTRAEMQTEVYMVFDDRNLYVAAKCHAVGKDYTVPTLRRDYRAGNSDNVSLVFDPFNDRINAFLFGMTPTGVNREALISGGGQDTEDFASSWDNKWFGEAGIHDGYWVAEFAIPFKTLRYNEGEKFWRFNCYRFDTQSNETSSWMRIPQNQIVMNLAFMGEMIWEEAPPKPGTNVAIIPYTIADYNKDFEAKKDGDFSGNLGGDAKIAVTSGMNLDLTINPDFSQVEVDEQLTNLTRFELFLPERRQFFQENSDLFGRFGAPSINPFFSRRVGIAFDTILQQNVQNPIYYGARLSGKLNNDWRLGLLNMQTASNERNGLPSYNYSVAAVQRRLFARSNIGAIFVNKQTFEEVPEDSEFTPYNRVVGLDYNLASSDNSWTGKAFYHRAITPEAGNQKFAYSTALFHQKRNYEFGAVHEQIGENFDAEVGFVPRTGVRRLNSFALLNNYPTKGKVIQHGPFVDAEVFLKNDQGRTDHAFMVGWFASFNDFSELEGGIINEYTRLFEEFNPTRADTLLNNIKLLQPGDYTYTYLAGEYASDRRKDFSFSLSPTIGQFFNGWRYGLSGSVIRNFPPFISVQLQYDINRVQLPKGFDSASLFLIGPRLDVTFSKALFLSTFLQYNNQIDNFNVNARLQWRFQPVSDFFLVYTDNYFASDLRTKSRAIVVKITYWLNM